MLSNGGWVCARMMNATSCRVKRARPLFLGGGRTHRMVVARWLVLSIACAHTHTHTQLLPRIHFEHFVVCLVQSWHASYHWMPLRDFSRDSHDCIQPSIHAAPTTIHNLQVVDCFRWRRLIMASINSDVTYHTCMCRGSSQRYESECITMPVPAISECRACHSQHNVVDDFVVAQTCFSHL